MTPGTSLWAIKQLLDGKKIRCPFWIYNEFIYLDGDKIKNQDNVENSFQYWFDGAILSWQLWTPPNPYHTGTFAWAWEELWRGNKVSCHEPSYTKTQPITYWFQGDKLMTQEGPYGNYVSTRIPVELIKSTNWKLA